ncbi:hypothetical protein [Dongshaea marina]|nr:hypothetical protein [Dongshaea marina]
MLYDAGVEKDNCGFGLIAHVEGKASHRLIRLSMSALARMQHRGGIGADQKTGDGCGLLMRLPEEFFHTLAAEQGWSLHRKFAVGTLYLSQDPIKAQHAREVVEHALKQQMLSVVGWRTVPVNAQVLGEHAAASLPLIEQVFINAPWGGQRLIWSGACISSDGR